MRERPGEGGEGEREQEGVTKRKYRGQKACSRKPLMARTGDMRTPPTVKNESISFVYNSVLSPLTHHTPLVERLTGHEFDMNI
jgi:hypothetical protein